MITKSTLTIMIFLVEYADVLSYRRHEMVKKKLICLIARFLEASIVCGMEQNSREVLSHFATSNLEIVGAIRQVIGDKGEFPSSDAQYSRVVEETANSEEFSPEYKFEILLWINVMAIENRYPSTERIANKSLGEIVTSNFYDTKSPEETLDFIYKRLLGIFPSQNIVVDDSICRWSGNKISLLIWCLSLVRGYHKGAESEAKRVSARISRQIKEIRSKWADD